MDQLNGARPLATAAAAGSLLAAVLLAARWQRRRRELPDAVSRRLASREFLAQLQRRRDFVDDFLAHLIIEGVAFLSHVDADGERIPYGTAPAARTAVKLRAHTPPVALVPAPIPADKYQDAIAISLAVCRLVDSIATDPGWLQDTFANLASIDDWTKNMLSLAVEVDTKDKIRLHVMRNDLMLDTPRCGVPWRQIEVNTFSASLPGQASRLSVVQRRLLAKHLQLCGVLSAETSLSVALPTNRAAAGLAEGMASAHRLYRSRYGPFSAATEPVLLFVIVSEEYNEADHRMLELELGERGVACVRRTMQELVAGSRLRQAGGGRPRFTLKDADTHRWLEVSVCYFRWGWTRVEGGWQWRRDLARSACVEAPSAGALLAGLKLSQAACAEPRRLQSLRALSECDRALLRSAAARQFDLGSEAGRAGARAALAEQPGGFLAKPARDGLGGAAHKFSQAELLQLLDDADQGHGLAQGWVIMEKVRPPVHPSLVLHSADLPADTDAGDLCSLRPSVAELGIYVVGVASGCRGRLATAVAGHLVRSKDVGSEDGGVCRGNAVIDVPLLTGGEWACRDSWSDAVGGAGPKAAGAFQNLGA